MKTYLIIGGSSGIGAAVVDELAHENNVMATYCKNYKKDNINVSFHELDVFNENPITFIPEKLDGLVYCPGSILLKPFARINGADFLKDYQLQVVGATKIIQSALPALKNSEQASVVLYSTIAVQRGFTFHSLVSASKGAIEGLTRALAAEFAPKIRFNCIAPSITNTPLASGLLNTPEKMEANAQRHPLKRIGTVSDIAKMTAFLLSENSSWMTGEILHVDGGMSSIK
ncbi:MAG TPA: SDR family oxidoreductase [Chitinophagales bacterium]|nr:SDR family oxidoreductase [Chitinophagales bacterium]